MEASNVWGILVVPIGVLICFGPALLVWLATEGRKTPPDEPKR